MKITLEELDKIIKHVDSGTSSSSYAWGWFKAIMSDITSIEKILNIK